MLARTGPPILVNPEFGRRIQPRIYLKREVTSIGQTLPHATERNRPILQRIEPPKYGLSPGLITGAIRDRPIIMEVATSHEDEAGYYHTRMRVAVKNAGAFIMGLRRKSYLELAQTRRDAAPFSLDDPQFERQFFL